MINTIKNFKWFFIISFLCVILGVFTFITFINQGFLFLNEDNLFSPKPLISSSDIFSKYFKFLSTTIKQYLKRFKMKVPNN